MKSYIHKATRFLKEQWQELPEKGVRATFQELRERLFHVSTSLVLFEQAQHIAAPIDKTLTIARYVPAQRDDISAHVQKAFPQLDAYFARGGTCFIASIDDAPVGIAWTFANSSLLARIAFHPEGLYIGDVWVNPSHRGKGIAGALLARIATQATPGTALVAEIDAEPLNHESKRAFEKTGFKVAGRVRLVTAGGIIARVTWLSRERWP